MKRKALALGRMRSGDVAIAVLVDFDDL